MSLSECPRCWDDPCTCGKRNLNECSNGHGIVYFDGTYCPACDAIHNLKITISELKLEISILLLNEDANKS